MTTQIATSSAITNYRIYDRTGGGGTEDIYAETLEDAIEAGREWIEAGDWSSEDGTYRTITLQCCVREIVRIQRWIPTVKRIGLAAYLVAGNKKYYLEGQTDGVSMATYELIKQACDNGTAWMTHAEIEEWIDDLVEASPNEDVETVYIEWEDSPQNADDVCMDGEIDEEATSSNDAHDCSGEYSDELPECEISEDGEHDWQSPHSVVGGIKENPGVWSNSGTCWTTKSVCACCGKYKSETDKGSQCHPDQASCVIEIEDADEASLAWIMRQNNGYLPDELGEHLSREEDTLADMRSTVGALQNEAQNISHGIWMEIDELDLSELTRCEAEEWLADIRERLEEAQAEQE